MPIPLPHLDDRTFDDLVAEGKRLIPGYAPSWTDHNPSDPGITFIELFAFLTEMLLYRVDRVSEANKRAFVKLLRGPKWEQKASLDEEIRNAVLELRTEERAVTVADFVDRASRVDGVGVARAYCLPRRNLESGKPDAATQDAPAHVSVIIVPKREQSGFPVAGKDLIKTVKTDLEPRCLLTTRLHVAAAKTLQVGVRLTVQAFADQKEEIVKNRVIDKLNTFFHPLKGGHDGQGWPLGRNVYNVYVSDLYAVVDQVDGVDYVKQSDGQPELFVVGAVANDGRRIPADAAKRLVGLRLEPNELVEFDRDGAETTITVHPETAVIPEE